MNAETIKKANELQKEIETLSEFLTIIEPTGNIQRGSGVWDISAFINVKIKKTFEFFGSRNVGREHMAKVIIVPNQLIDELHQVCKKKLNKLKRELSQL